MNEPRGEPRQPTDRLKVFINYRRADTEGYAGRLYEALRRPIGTANLFMDVDSMRPGQNFVRALDDAVAGCDVVLAMIGPAWLRPSADGRRRIDDPLDYVRLEIESGLSRGKVVIPLLFTGAEMPSALDLPEPLRDLPTRNALAIRHERFRDDVAELVKELRRQQALKDERTRAALSVGAVSAATAERADRAPDLVAGPLVAGQNVGRTRKSPVEPPPRPAEVQLIEPVARGAVRPRGPGSSRPVAVALGIVALAAAAIVAVLALGPGRAAPGGAAMVGTDGSAASAAAGVVLATPEPSPSVAPSPSSAVLPSPSLDVGSEDARYRSPDGSLAAFVHMESNGYFEIYVERADGSDVRNVSNHPDSDLFVTWRPDSRRIAFISHRDLNDEVYAVDADGSNLTRLTSTPEDEGWPRWSPDGSLILYTRSSVVDRQIDLWLMTPTGTQQRAVVTSPEDEGLPSWTPDGRIRFTRFTKSGTQDYVVNADGSGLTMIP